MAEVTMAEAEAAYRRLNPPTMPYSIHARRPELSDLWPADQERFRRDLARILSSCGEG